MKVEQSQKDAVDIFKCHNLQFLHKNFEKDFHAKFKLSAGEKILHKFLPTQFNVLMVGSIAVALHPVGIAVNIRISQAAGEL